MKSCPLASCNLHSGRFLKRAFDLTASGHSRVRRETGKE
jgi:hypothetical protein